MPALYPLFYNNLQDNIPSVRQGAALALANVAQVYGKHHFQTKPVDSLKQDEIKETLNFKYVYFFVLVYDYDSN